MHITKMHGLGNSQILVEDLEEDLENTLGLDYSEIARALCNPDFGIGSDQALIILPSEKADFRMRVFNRDGGEAEMCGNGIRCVAKYLLDRDMVDENPSIETEAEINDLKIRSEGGGTKIKVDMGRGKLLEEDKRVGEFEGSYVSIGNPHFIIFTEEASEELSASMGPELENADEFQPERTNVEFANPLSRDEIETYVWERGAGLTLACGTGACATAFAAKKKGLVGSNVKVHLPGGRLAVEVDDEGRLRMEGPAEYILEGEVLDISEIYSNLE